MKNHVGVKADQRRKGATVGVGLALVALMFACGAVGCTAMPQNRLRARLDIRAGFPGFRVTVFDAYENWNLLGLDGGELLGYRFELESEDVVGFAIAGDYRLAPLRSKAMRDVAVRRGMFSGASLTREEIVAFQRAWVASRPGEKVLVGDTELTGPLALVLERESLELKSEPPRPEDIYCIASTSERVDPLSFFRLDRTTGEWTFLPIFNGEYLDD